LRQDLQQVIASAASLPSRADIRAMSVGDVVILRGNVTTDHERRLTEAIVRLTPGVLAVQNELKVQPPKTGP
jgi:osmotically-inducible protein OsmY